MNFLKSIFMSIFYFCLWSVVYSCMFVCLVWFLLGLQLPDILVRLHKTWPIRMQQVSNLTDTVKNMFSKSSTKIIIDTYVKQEEKPSVKENEEITQELVPIIPQEETQENVTVDEKTLKNNTEVQTVNSDIKNENTELETIILVPAEKKENSETSVPVEPVPQVVSQKEAPTLLKELETQINPGTLVQK